jgi:hypothetical protein
MLLEKNSIKTILTFIFVVLVSSACSGEKAAFERAQQQDDVSAYRVFLKEYPDSEFSTNANSRIEELIFEEAKTEEESGDIEKATQSYGFYVRNYPDGEYVEIVQERLAVLQAQAQEGDDLSVEPELEQSDFTSLKVVNKANYPVQFMLASSESSEPDLYSIEPSGTKVVRLDPEQYTIIPICGSPGELLSVTLADKQQQTIDICQ